MYAYSSLKQSLMCLQFYNSSYDLNDPVYILSCNLEYLIVHLKVHCEVFKFLICIVVHMHEWKDNKILTFYCFVLPLAGFAPIPLVKLHCSTD